MFDIQERADCNITFNDTKFLNSNNSTSEEFEHNNAIFYEDDVYSQSRNKQNNSNKSKNNLKQTDINVINTQERRSLSFWGLPENILDKYEKRGLKEMFEWQTECLNNKKLLEENCNLVYSAPTSAGKTLVAEILAMKTVLERQKKVILILPFVSVVREKMFYFQDILNSSGIRVDGFMGSHNPPGGFKSVQLAICTIEKANGIINRLLEESNLQELGAVIIDEIHLLGDPSRGYLLELLLTKLRYMCKKSKEVHIQIIGMSATLPNLALLSQWLDAELYVTDFRPIPLNEYYLIEGDIFNNNLKLERHLQSLPELVEDTDHVLQLCLETINQSCSVLIFCPTKNWCENLAQQISTAIRKLGRSNSQFGITLREQLNTGLIGEVLEQLEGCPVGLDFVLKKSVSFGVAFHHAGLTMDERDIIEGAFRSGALRILIATSTLSSGVNLPARRVIIRTPMFHGKPIDVLTYHQMIGRAGRMGQDTAGESVLVCQKNNKNVAVKLMSLQLRPVESCLEGAGKLKRAILEVIASGVASTPDDVKLFTNCTLLATSEADFSEESNPIDKAMEFLLKNEFIRSQTSNAGEVKYVATSLAKACLASSVPPEDGLALFEELERARQCFVLDTDLHLLYLVTPYSASNQWGNIDWMLFLNLWEKLPANMRRVGDLAGVRESYIISATRGQINTSTSKSYHKLQVHRRFFTALALQDLVNEVPLNNVAAKFSCSRGTLQSLQQSASTFAGMVTSFCHQLGWNSLEILVSQFQDRLQFGVQHELIDLMKLSHLNGPRARTLYNAGIETISDLATFDVCTLENILYSSVPFQSEKERDGETSFDVEQKKKIRSIWITGKEGVTPREAAVLLIEDARKYLQFEMGAASVKWGELKNQNDSDVNEAINSSDINNSDTAKNMPRINNTSSVSNTIAGSIDKKVNETSNIDKLITSLDTDNENNINCIKTQNSPDNCDKNSICNDVHSNESNCAVLTELSSDTKLNVTSTAKIDVSIPKIENSMDLTDHNTTIDNCLQALEVNVTSMLNVNNTSEIIENNENVNDEFVDFEWSKFEENLTHKKSILMNTTNEPNNSISYNRLSLNNSVNTSNKSLFDDSLNLDSKLCNIADISCNLTNEEQLVKQPQECNEMLKSNTTETSCFNNSLDISGYSSWNENIEVITDNNETDLQNRSLLENIFNSSFSMNEIEENINNSDIIDTSSPEITRSSIMLLKSAKKRKKLCGENEDNALNETPKKKKKNSSKENKVNRCMNNSVNESDTSNNLLMNLKIDSVQALDLTSINIIDVCGDQKLFDTFSLELSKQSNISISIGCEYFKVEKSCIGQKIIKSKDSSKIENNLNNPLVIVDEKKINCVCICWGSNTVYHISLQNIKYIKHNKKVSLIQNLFKTSGLTIRMFDCKEQCKLLIQACDITISCRLEDPKIADWMLEPEGKEKSLLAMALKYCPEIVGIAQLGGQCRGAESIGLNVKSVILSYVRASVDAIVTWHILESQIQSLLFQDCKLLNTFSIEMKSIVCLIFMELTGLGVDKTKINKLVDNIKQQLVLLEQKAYSLAGKHFSMMSSKDVAKVLGMYRGKKISTNKQVLEQSNNPISNIILQWRKLSCTLTKMILPIIRVVKNNRIHGNCLTHSSTGRISMQEPNLQNVPRNFEIIKPDGKVLSLSVRASFVPSKDKIYVSADYCQLELRILSHLSQDPTLIQIMRSDVDVFKSIAAKLRNITESEVNDILRQKAKQLCYGIIYGMGPKALSQQLDSTEIEALEFMESFKNNYPSIKLYIQETIDQCKQNGYVETLGGRRRYLPHISQQDLILKNQAERQAVNTTIQGSAADIAKSAMVLVDEKLRLNYELSERPSLVLHLHDELLYEVYLKDLKHVLALIKFTMEGAITISVPLPVKLRCGPSWGELEDFEL